MRAVRESLSGLLRSTDAATGRRRAVEAAKVFTSVLVEHLEREEAVAFPCILAALTERQWADLTEQARKRGSLATLSFEVPWIVDHADADEVPVLFADAPAVFRIVHGLVWRRRYERRAALIRSSRHERGDAARRRRLALPAVLALAAALVLTISACGTSDSSQSASGAAVAADVDRLPSTLDLEATDYTFRSEADAVAAGPVTVRLTNRGQEAHQVQIGRITGDLTPEEFVQVFHDRGEAAAFELLEWVGGVNGTEPGETQQATTVFEPGNYLMVCFIPDAEGRSHVLHDMVVPLEVAGRSDAAVPVADDVITLTDYAVGLPQGFTGKGVYEVKNEGRELHELILFRLHDDKTIADLSAWASGGMKGPAPYDTTGGAATIQPGTSSWVTLDLRPGNYVGLCVVTSPTTMQQHVQMGMATPFVVT